MADIPKRSERVIARSPLWGTVEYAVRLNGDMEARDWLEDQSKQIQASFGVLFQKIASGQRITNQTQFRHLGGAIWEFKRGGQRIAAFQAGKSWFLTHHFKKGGTKCPPREIARAENIREECLKVLAHEQQAARRKDGNTERTNNGHTRR
jgi:phage-related protein